MASGWNLWVWLECIGVVSGCCCKEVHTVRVEIFGSVIFSVNRERRCSVERNFRYLAHCLFEGVANVG